MSSILTNSSAMVALQTLKGINKDLSGIQNQVSTGLKVSNAKDNAATWSIAATMDQDIAILEKLSENLDKANAVIGVGRSAAEQIKELAVKIQERVAQGAGASAAEQTKLGAEIVQLGNTISSIAESAQMNGMTLTGNTNGANVNVTMSVVRDGSGAITSTDVMTVTAVDLYSVGTALGALAADGSTASLETVNTQLTIITDAAAAWGAAQARIEAQNEYLSNQADALVNGVSALRDADMEAASARLTALQTQQQLGTQALSIANQAPQSLLSLFR
jgi:flagellin